MKSTKDLMEEHESVMAFLAILETILSNIQSEKKVNLEDLQWLFEFNRDFILKGHCDKEGSLFFPALESMAIPPESIDYLIAEHEIAWSIAKTMRGLIQDYIEGRSDFRGDIISLGTVYIDFMKDHINKEENILFPLVNESISIDMDERLAFKFRLFIEERIGIGRYLDLQELLSYFKMFYGI
jgi:hemerythrin-like domain-containing protein